MLGIFERVPLNQGTAKRMTDEDDLIRFDNVTAQGFEFFYELLDGVIFRIGLDLRVA